MPMLADAPAVVGVVAVVFERVGELAANSTAIDWGRYAELCEYDADETSIHKPRNDDRGV